MSLAAESHALFSKHYRTIGRLLCAHQDRGLLILAVDDGELLEARFVRTGLNHAESLVVGRHERCDLVLRRSHVAGRHLLVLAQATGLTDTRTRILDLLSPSGFLTETDEPLRSFTFEGSCSIRVGSTVLMFLCTSPYDVVPASAEEALLLQPPVVAIAREPRGARMLGRHVHARLISHQPVCGSIPHAGPLCSPDESSCGVLLMRTDEISDPRRVSERTLTQGLLVGGHERCDIGLWGRDRALLSRVHLVLIKDGDRLLAIDAASSNGTFDRAGPVSCLDIGTGARLNLAGALELEWMPS